MHVTNYIRANSLNNSNKKAFMVTSNMSNTASEQQTKAEKNVLWKIEIASQISTWFVRGSSERADASSPSNCSLVTLHQLNVCSWTGVIRHEGKGKVCEALARPAPTLQNTIGPCSHRDTNSHRSRSHVSEARCTLGEYTPH